MRFGEALEAMRVGSKVRRRSWPEYTYITLDAQDFFWAHEPCKPCYIAGMRWHNVDILACDWEIVK